MAVDNKTKDRNKKSLRARYHDFISRRPHRTFRLTKKRDYARSFELPGYWSFTNEVRAVLWQNRQVFLRFFLIYTILSIIFVGIMSQDVYLTFLDSLNNLKEIPGGEFGDTAQTFALFGATITGSLNQSPTESQQIYSGLFFLLGWLVTVWLLRQILAGHKINVRDALYSAGAPIVSTLLIALLVLVQLLPIALALIVYGVAQQAGLLEQGFISMIFWVISILLGLMSLYWIVSSLIALVIVTLPGMYPMTAIRNASDLVVGRRLRVSFRLSWLFLIVMAVWGLVLIPVIILTQNIQITWLPLVPVVAAFLSSFTLIFASSYIYLLYRKLIDDKEQPA